MNLFYMQLALSMVSQQAAEGTNPLAESLKSPAATSFVPDMIDKVSLCKELSSNFKMIQNKMGSFSLYGGWHTCQP